MRLFDPRSHPRSARGLLAVGAALLAGTVGTAWAGVGADLDRTFSGDGRAIDGFATGMSADVVQQPDGKLVVVSTAANGGFALARYNPDGSLDTTFADGGHQTTDVGPGDETGVAVDLLPDGRIVAAGSSGSDFAVARYATDGELDPTFSGDGRQTVDFGGAETGSGLDVRQDGKVVIGGTTGPAGGMDFALARLDDRGELDASFSEDGRLTTDFAGGDDQGRDVVSQPDGGVVIVGGAQKGAYDTRFALARYAENGAADPSFGDGGKQTTDLSRGSSEIAEAVALAPDGKLVVAGGANFAVARYGADGSLDPSFSSDGVQDSGVNGAFSKAADVTVQPDGKVVVAGYAEQRVIDGDFGEDFEDRDFALARYNVDGMPDTQTFSAASGTVMTDFGGGTDGATGVALQSDGKLVAAGYAGAREGGPELALARYEGRGELRRADVSVDATDPASVQQGQRFAVTATVRNDGPHPALNTVLTAESRPSGSGRVVAVSRGCTLSNGFVRCELGDIGAGQTRRVGITVEARAAGRNHILDVWAGSLGTADGTGPGSSDNNDEQVKTPMLKPSSPRPECRLLGTPASDIMMGTDAKDFICGFGGDDLIRGQRGDDVVAAGAGDDVVFGGGGADRLLGQKGADSLDTRDGVRANDLADGGAGADRCRRDEGDRRTSC